MSDELKRDYQEKLGKKFGAIFNGVSYDWANGLVRLNEYRALFGDQDNIEFINTFSGPFMGDVQRVFRRDLLLHITRLTDRVGSGDKKNLTVNRLTVIFPGESGQVDYAAHVTFRTCRLSNALGLRYPSDECSRYGL